MGDSYGFVKQVKGNSALFLHFTLHKNLTVTSYRIYDSTYASSQTNIQTDKPRQNTIKQ